MEDRRREEKKILVKGALYGALAMFMVAVLVLTGLTVFGKISLHTEALDADTARKAAEIQNIIEKKFLYADNIEEEDLRDLSLKGYVAGLGDPYSVYYNPDEMKEDCPTEDF